MICFDYKCILFTSNHSKNTLKRKSNIINLQKMYIFPCFDGKKEIFFYNQKGLKTCIKLNQIETYGTY